VSDPVAEVPPVPRAPPDPDPEAPPEEVPLTPPLPLMPPLPLVPPLPIFPPLPLIPPLPLLPPDEPGEAPLPETLCMLGPFELQVTGESIVIPAQSKVRQEARVVCIAEP
jgi:hypothetical protein